MEVYGLKFREKGSKDYISTLIVAKDTDDLEVQFTRHYIDDLGYDVDKRTVSWAGANIPLLRYDSPAIIYANLDNIT